MYFIKIICSWCQPYHNLAQCGCNQKFSWLFDPKTRYWILLQHIENPTYGMDGFLCVSVGEVMKERRRRERERLINLSTCSCMIQLYLWENTDQR